MLYPLKFEPILKYALWGGRRLIEAGKSQPVNNAPDAIYGESWELSGLAGRESEVANGPLKSNTINELAEIYMGDLLGDEIYDIYGEQFPLLIKFIDANCALSVQVHPDDDTAMERHGTAGKTEMWYVVDAQPGAAVYIGFRRDSSPEELAQAIGNDSVEELLQRYEVSRGDAFFIPAGTVHAIGAGVLLAEIQQTSDITYRIYDWGRVESDGKPRELNVGDAIDVIDYHSAQEYRCRAVPRPNAPQEIVSTDYFTADLLSLEGTIERDLSMLDSFVIYICVDGCADLTAEGRTEKVSALETVLIPAQCDRVQISGKGVLLEVFIK